MRWDAPDGPRLGGATGPDFSTRVRIPKVPGGLYTLIVLERQQDGSIGNAASAPFEVTDGERAGEGRGPAGGNGPSSGSRPAGSSEPSWPALAAGGFALVLLGALGGALLRRLGPRRT